MTGFYKAKSCLTKFGEIVKNKLKSIKDLRLEWCKIEEYHPNEKYGSYLSQTHLEHARVGRWFHAHMMEIKDILHTEKYYFNNNKAIKHQTNSDMKEWLKSRNISLKLGGKVLTRKQMRSTVTRFYNSSDEEICM